MGELGELAAANEFLAGKSVFRVKMLIKLEQKYGSSNTVVCKQHLTGCRSGVEELEVWDGGDSTGTLGC